MKGAGVRYWDAPVRNQSAILLGMAFVPLSFERPTPEIQLADAKAFTARLATRRSVRHFSPEPVPMEVLDLAIAAAGS